MTGDKSSSSSRRREIEKQRNNCGIVLEALKALCVSDICYSINGNVIFNSDNAEEHGHRNGVSTTNKGYRKEIEQEKDNCLMYFEKGCEDLFGPYVRATRS